MYMVVASSAIIAEERFFGPFAMPSAAEDPSIAVAAAGLMGVTVVRVRLTARSLWTVFDATDLLRSRVLASAGDRR